LLSKEGKRYKARERKKNEKERERISREREDEKSQGRRLQSKSFVSKGAAGQEVVVITPTQAYRVVKG
jgi:hypothetical protein